MYPVRPNEVECAQLQEPHMNGSMKFVINGAHSSDTSNFIEEICDQRMTRVSYRTKIRSDAQTELEIIIIHLIATFDLNYHYHYYYNYYRDY